MVPQNESAVIVLACQELDLLLKRKYIVFGASFATFVFLVGVAIAALFVNENWFLFLFSLPFLTWYLSEQHQKRVNRKINYNISVIKLHHEHKLLRKASYCTSGATNTQYYCE